MSLRRPLPRGVKAMRTKLGHVETLSFVATFLLLLCAGGGRRASAQSQNPVPGPQPAAQSSQDETQRGDIYSSEFTNTRPAGKVKGTAGHTYKVKRPAPPPTAKKGAAAAGRRAPPARDKVYMTVGVTIGRGRPATEAESLDTDVAKVRLQGSRELVFERAQEGEPVLHGSLIQMAVEYLAYTDPAGKTQLNQIGYLYVINRVRFPGGHTGLPALIFPTKRTRGGDNRVVPGQPVLLPSWNRPWQITRSKTGVTQAYETYVVIVSPQPLTDERGFELREDNADPKTLETLLGRWERLWGGGEMRAVLSDGAGRLLTRREQAAGADPNDRRRDTGEIDAELTQDDPPPQTIFRKAVALGEAMLVTVELPFRESAPPAP